MSSERSSPDHGARDSRATTGKPGVRGARAGVSRRTASIARSVTWGFWWRKLVTWLSFDLLLVMAFAALFAWSCARDLPPAALDGITGDFFGMHVVRDGSWSLERTGDTFDGWAYVIYGGDDVTYRFPVAGAVRMLTPFALVAVIFELLDLLGFLSATRRVRRRLQPLNDLALMAEAMGNAAAADPLTVPGADKMAILEAAISRVSVDAPQVTTGDADLASIEVALNGLLRQMQEAKLQQMRFVSDASHELRTPIAVIQGYVNLLDRWGKADEEVRDEAIEALKGESEHMQELVEQLLFLARGDSGRNTLQLSQLNLAAVVREVGEESAMIDTAHAYVCDATEAEAGDVAYELRGDLALLKQSLRIIVGNAAKYSSAGSTVRLSVASAPDSVSYVVADEGIGLSETDVAHIFDRFWRADAGRDSGAAGTGLGLSIAKWIVDAHGGSIAVLSHEGVGTRFTVTLPRRGT